MATRGHRPSRRLATRYADRGHGSFLSRAVGRLEIPLLAAYCLRVRTSGGHERFQGAAGPLGQGVDANGEKNSAESFSSQRSLAYQGGSVFSSHGKHFVSTDDHSLHDVVARHDRAFLSRVVSDVVDRPAAVFGVDVLDFQFLFSCTTRAAAENVVA